MRSGRTIRSVAAFGWVAALAAQQQPTSVEQTQVEVAKARRDLQQARTTVDDLLDARIRHDLGLPVDDDLALFAVDAPATTRTIAEAELSLAQEDVATTGLLGRYQRLKQLVDQLRVDAEQSAGSDPLAECLTVRARGAVLRGWLARVVPRVVEPASADPGDSVGMVAQMPVRVVPNLDPIKARITGSSDRGRVAISLFKAGQALLDRSDELRRQGQSAAADAVDEQAAQRLERALAELQELAAAEQSEFVDLFYLGKSRELLFVLDERRKNLSPESDVREYRRREQEIREPFLAIAARDFVTRDGSHQPGPWARAAQAAMEHIRWRNLHAGYRPKVSPESITWPGQAGQ